MRKWQKKQCELLYIGNDCMCVLLTVSQKIIHLTFFTLEEILPSVASPTISQKQNPRSGIFDEKLTDQIAGL